MFQERIKDKYDELSPRFRALADFILENTLDVGFLTATELARRVDVDPATVVRFSQELGYSGYRELSREIKEYINNDLALRYEKGALEAEGLEKRVSALADELSDRIRGMKVDSEHIADVARSLTQAQRVFAVGKADGYGLAALWATYLRMVGYDAYAVEGSVPRAALMLRDLEESDLVVTVSLGLDPHVEMGHLLSLAGERGAKTISITASPTLIPARVADVNLSVETKTPSGYPSFDTIAALLSLIWQAVVLQNEGESEASVSRTTETLRSLTEQREPLADYDFDALLRLWEPQQGS